MTASTLTIVIAVASLLFLILGTVIAVLTIFTRRSDRNMERSEARQTEAIKQQEARQTEALNQFKAEVLAILKQQEARQTEASKQQEARQTEASKQQEARQTEALNQQEARQTEALNQFKAQILATLKRIEDGQADQNEQISELARAMYVLNGQVQRIVGYLRTEGIEVNEDILSATQPAISSISAQR